MHSATGTTLIEILISMLLISILLLGVDAMQVISLKQAKVNYYFAAAEQQINNLIEELSINHNPDLVTWNKQNQIVLPQGRGVMTKNAIAIFWGSFNEEKCEANKIGTSGCLRIQLS